MSSFWGSLQRISNSGDQAATNVVVSFQWTSSNTYVNLSPYETLVISLGNIGPGQQIDVFWLVEIARTKSAINTTRGFRIDVTSEQTSATASQTLTVEGLNSQGQDNSIIVNAPTTVYVGDTFVVEAEATITRSPSYISFPLQFDRSLFELYQVRLDYYVNSDFSGNVALTEYDIYYSVPGGSIPYHGVRAYFTLRAVRAGTGRFASLQMDVNRNQTAFDYNSTIWQYSMQVISLNPSLTISKSDSPDPAPPGGNITYTVTYGNTGYGNATNVVITDPIPGNTSYVRGSAFGESGVSIEYYDGTIWSSTEPLVATAIRWVVGSVLGNSTGHQAGFQATIGSGVAVGTLIENRATLIANAIGATAVAITTVGSPPNLAISKTDSTDPVEPGALLGYTITYGNTGAASAGNVVVTDPIPTNTSYVSGSASGEAGVTIQYYDGTVWSSTEPSIVRAIRWVMGTLDTGVTGQQARFQVILAPDVPGGSLIENRATITSDQTPQTAIQITTVTNQPPVAVNDAYSTNEDTTLNITAPGVLGNDTDIDSPNLTAILVSNVSNGTLILNSNGNFTYAPNPNWNGTDSFAYMANDGIANSNVATVTITVNPVNDPPVAVNDAYSTNEDTTLNIPAPGVLGNDTDIDSPNLTAILVSNAGNGTLILSSSGNFTYTPNPNWNGTDSFTYMANDGIANSNVATVTITVNPVQNIYTLTMAVSGSGSTTPAAGSYSYAEGTVVSISATASTGWHFSTWSANVANPGSASTTVTMDADKTVTATFAQDQYTLTINIVGQGNVTRVPNQPTYTYGTSVQLTAVPQGGWSFSSWSGDLPGSTNPDTIVMNGNRTVTANFSYPPAVATDSAQNVTSGSVTLRGILNDKGTATTISVSFEWATDNYYTNNGNSYNNETTPPWPMFSTGAFGFALGGISPETTYHFRAKAIGEGTAHGVDMTFTTIPLQPPNQPPNAHPIQGARCVTLPTTLQSAPFSDPDPGDTQAASQWQIRTDTGSYASPVYDSGNDTLHLTSIALSETELNYSATYYWHIRHEDNHGAWSNWSEETYFMTADTRTGSDITVIRGGTSVKFYEVSAGGCTWVTTSDTNPVGSAPTNITAVGSFMDIVTTATHTGPIEVDVAYDPAATRNLQNLRLFHWNGSSWEDVTTSVDTTNNIVHGQVNSLSWFLIGGQWVWIEGAGVPVFPDIYIGIAAVLGAGVLAYFIRRRLVQQG